MMKLQKLIRDATERYPHETLTRGVAGLILGCAPSKIGDSRMRPVELYLWDCIREGRDIVKGEIGKLAEIANKGELEN
jgi:hypothetical protein